MKLQRNSSIALCSVLEAAADPVRQIVAADIAIKYGVSPHHLAKVLRRLSQAGLLASARGVGGGYRFTGNARRLTLLDVIELFEDISARAPESSDQEYRTAEGKALASVLIEIDETARATLHSISIATMLNLAARHGAIPSVQAEAPPRRSGLRKIRR